MYIESLKDLSIKNTAVNGTYVITRCELKPFKQKTGFFLNCELTDKTGSIKGVIWENAERIIKEITNRSVINITGEVTRYNDIPQLIISRIKKAEEYNKKDFLPSLESEKINNILVELENIQKTIKNPFYKKIWKFLVEKDIHVTSTLFHECPGGVGAVHHAYLGGLLEHSASMIRTARCLIGDSKGVDLETVMTGCLIHDIGKIEAYNWDIVIEMNDRGRLMHHVPLGMQVLSRIIEELYEKLTEEEEHYLMLLQHIMVSHHEDKESIRKPMTAEAQIVAGLDNLDAAANYSIAFINNENNHEQDTNWTRYSSLTERRYYKPIVKEEIIPDVKPKRIESDSIF